MPQAYPNWWLLSLNFHQFIGPLLAFLLDLSKARCYPCVTTYRKLLCLRSLITETRLEKMRKSVGEVEWRRFRDPVRLLRQRT